jgi:D-alanyl-lipoteichoic acid acyltransferase DltB (MBOAT superfamily)
VFALPEIAVVPGTESISDLFDSLWRLPRSWDALWKSDILWGRNAAAIYLVAMPLLMLFAGRNLRWAIVITGLAFVGYVFGGAFLVFWLVSCLAFYALSQKFAIEAKRKDVWQWGPPLAAIAIIAGYFVLAHTLDNINLGAVANSWLLANARWLFPLGYRELPWEPAWPGNSHQFFNLILYRSHDIGTAYLVMRMISYFSEIKRGTIEPERRTLLNFMAYVCYAPTLIQGPIERFNEFNAEIDTCHERRLSLGLLVGLGRMALAVVKMVVLLGYYGPWLGRMGMFSKDFYLRAGEVPSYAVLLFAIHLQVFGFYLLFSAYCDLVIGMSRLLGYRVVENFRWPWIARSLTDMWRRWHISMSFILRDYIYFPLTRKRWNGVLTAFVTFLVCGIWHGVTGNYIVWGAVMGLLVAVNQKWSRWMRNLDRHPQRRLAAVRRAWMRLQPLPVLCSWLLTINVFIMSGWICLWGPGAIGVVWELIRRPLQWALGPWGVTLAPLVLERWR